MWRERHQLESLVQAQKDVIGGTSMARLQELAHLEDFMVRLESRLNTFRISHIKAQNMCASGRHGPKSVMPPLSGFIVPFC